MYATFGLSFLLFVTLVGTGSSYLVTLTEKYFKGCDSDGCWIETVALVFILGLAVVASVTGGAMAIVIQKDWVVVLHPHPAYSP